MASKTKRRKGQVSVVDTVRSRGVVRGAGHPRKMPHLEADKQHPSSLCEQSSLSAEETSVQRRRRGRYVHTENVRECGSAGLGQHEHCGVPQRRASIGWSQRTRGCAKKKHSHRDAAPQTKGASAATHLSNILHAKLLKRDHKSGLSCHGGSVSTANETAVGVDSTRVGQQGACSGTE
jgi:hypothetical protein